MAKKKKTQNKAKARYKAQNRRNRQKVRQERQRVENSMVAGKSGAGGVQDRGASQRINRMTSHPLDLFRGTWQRAKEWSNLYWKEWTARKIIEIPIDDMLRNRWEYDGLDEEATKLVEKNLVKLRFNRALREALRLERLIGGSMLLMGVRDTQDNPEKPLDYNNVQQGDLQFVNVIPRTRITTTQFEYNPLSPSFGKPIFYVINGERVHESRVLIFDGDPLTQNPRDDFSYNNSSRDGFGESVLAPIYDDILRSISSRQAATQLIMRASVLLINNENMLSSLESSAGKEAFNKLNDLADQMDIYQAAMIDGKKITMDQWSANFGSVPELMEKFLQIISAGSDIPATRFLGVAPGGLNATGDADLENYYNMIDAKRENNLRVNLEKFFQVQMRSLFGNDFKPEMLELKFPPLWNLSELEEANVRQIDGNNIITAFNSGMVDATFANAEMVERKVWTECPEGDELIAPPEEPDATESSGDALAKLRAALPADQAGASDADILKAYPETGETEETELAIDPEFSLNGAQVTSLLAVIEAVSTKDLPRENGINIIQAAFPVDKEQAESILGEIGRTFFKEPEEKPPPKVV